MADRELITVTGSTGYVGGRLVPILLQNGYRVRCVTRSVGSLQDREWTGDIEIVEADLEEKNEVCNVKGLRQSFLSCSFDVSNSKLRGIRGKDSSKFCQCF